MKIPGFVLDPELTVATRSDWFPPDVLLEIKAK